MEIFQTRARELVWDGILGYDQKVRNLTALATDTLPYPARCASS